MEMIGFIKIPDEEKQFFYKFENKTLTIYKNIYFSLGIHIDLEIESSNKYFFATNIENSSLVIFFVDKTPFKNKNPIIDILKVYYYIDKFCKDHVLINEMCFKFDELDYFLDHNTEIYLKENLTTETPLYKKDKMNFAFKYENMNIVAKFDYMRIPSYDLASPPKYYNQLTFKFKKLLKMDFILNLYLIAREIFCILCYRRNIRMNTVELYGITEDGIKCHIGILHVFTNCSYYEDGKLLKETIKYKTIENHLSKLFQVISDHKVYTEHIPETKQDGNNITVARTMLITAAFEWTFKQTHNNITLSLGDQTVKEDIQRVINSLLKEKPYNSKQKKKLKYYQNLINTVDLNLAAKIQYALKECSSILDPFIKHLFIINTIDIPSYSKIANDLQYQRNAYAHGEIDRTLDKNIILDVIILEWLNYCMLFQHIGCDKNVTFNVINQIFTRRLKEKTDAKTE